MANRWGEDSLEDGGFFGTFFLFPVDQQQSASSAADPPKLPCAISSVTKT